MTAEQMREIVVGAVARGWCHKDNEQKVMDPDLAVAIIDEVIRALPPEPPIIAELEAAIEGLFGPVWRLILRDEACIDAPCNDEECECRQKETRIMREARTALASLATYRGRA